MAVMRTKDARALSEKDFAKKIDDLRLELAKERGKISVGSPAEKPGKMKATKRAIARMLTINAERKVQKK